QGVLSMETREVHSERTFEAESCASVASAAALIIAVALEEGPAPPPTPARSAAPPAARAARVAARAPTVTGKAAPRPEPPDDDEPASYASQLIVDLGGIGDAGVMPDGPAGGGEIAAGWALGTSTWRLRLIAGGAYFPAHT